MANELHELMVAAWKRIEARVMGDPEELRRRLARRRSKTFEGVPRALCVALRAADRRISPIDWCMGPRWATRKGEEAEHLVFINHELMKVLSWPVEVGWPGEMMTDLQVKLGCGDGATRAMRRNGVVGVRYIKGLAGKRGRPVPVAHTKRELDACWKGKSGADDIMAPYWRHLSWYFPVGIEQVVLRRPVMREVDGVRRRYGWAWVCPVCGRTATTIYFPLRAPWFARKCGVEIAAGEVDEVAVRSASFACWDCHGVRGFSRTEKGIAITWNHIVMHCSEGLLYGKEVERPAWFTVMRKHKPFARKAASPRLDELAELLADGELSMADIARRMGVGEESARVMSYRVYKRRGVKGREGLVAGRREVGGAAGAAA